MHPSRRFALAGAWLLACAGLAAGQASPDRVLIDAQLNRQLVTDVRFEGDRVVYERGGQTESAPLDGTVVALVEPSTVAPRPRDGWIELTDGQRLVGMPVYLTSAEAAEIAAASDQDGLAWSTPLLGRLRVPLEALRRVVLKETAATAEFDQLEDVLVLANGDRTTGLLERLWPDVVLDVEGQLRTFELTAIASITLANPDSDRVGSRVWLSDGSIVAVDRLATTGDGVRLDLAAPLDTGDRPLAALTMNEILAVAFESGGVRPLADLGAPRWEPIADWTLPPVVGNPDRTLLGSAEVELIGPVAASWALPSDVRRVAIRARLRDDCRVWGDCQVMIRVGEGQWQAARLHGEHPESTFTIDLPTAEASGGRPLEVRVEAGEGGAIQDRVLLDGFILLASRAG
jgi:hypothetical protein